MRLILPVLLLSSLVPAYAASLPDDVGYMLSDLYGDDRKKWPAIRYPQDLNHDGFTDWVIQKKNCSTASCPAEIFVCKADKQGNCHEYCYIEVRSLQNIAKQLTTLKCESTC